MKMALCKTMQEKKSPSQPCVPALNNHQIKSEVQTSTGRENIRKCQPRTGEWATHVPDICVRACSRGWWALSQNTAGGIPGKLLAAAEVRMAPHRLPARTGWYGASCSMGEHGQALWADPRWGCGLLCAPNPGSPGTRPVSRTPPSLSSLANVSHFEHLPGPARWWRWEEPACLSEGGWKERLLVPVTAPALVLSEGTSGHTPEMAIWARRPRSWCVSRSPFPPAIIFLHLAKGGEAEMRFKVSNSAILPCRLVGGDLFLPPRQKNRNHEER